jgi:Beta-propeller repeat
MQTKSALVRIAIMASIPLAVLALLLWVRLQSPAHSSQSSASNHTAASAQPATPLSSTQKQDLTSAYGKLPLAFEANQGQSAALVRYLARGQGYQLFLTNQEAVLTLREPTAAGTKSVKATTPLAARTHRKLPVAEIASALRVHFDGANSAAEIIGTEQLPGKTNYFIGGDRTKWHTDVPSYAAVRYQGIYPGVDVLFYGREQRLEYDFVVAPGADPKAIALGISGARKLQIDSHGDLVMSAPGGKVTLQKPLVYQEVNGERREIGGIYAIASDRQVRFSVAKYDHTKPLTIDPILDYSTFLGGSGTGTLGDSAFALAVDAAGNAYLAGQTFSTDYPQMNPESSTPPSDIAADGTAFVSELSPDGSTLLYSTYLGGSGTGDIAEAITVDTATPVNIYVTGETFSTDFPVSGNALTPPPTGTATGGSAFVTKLNPTLSGANQLVYSTILGGDTSDDGHAIAVDTTGNIYVDGITFSTNFPTLNPLFTQTSLLNGNAFLTEINPSTGALVFSTYLGGTGAGGGITFPFADDAFGIAFGGSSEVFLVGATTSTDFPTHGTQVDPCRASGSAFLTEINVATPAVTYSTCLGGTTEELGNAIALGPGNLAYLTGETFSPNFPTVPAGNTIPAQGAFAGPSNSVGFFSVINTTTGALTYSTLLGGSNGDIGNAIAVDSSGNAYITGFTGSSNFPITQGAFQTTDNNVQGTTFITEVNPAGANAQAQLVYSTYLGGSKGAGTNPFMADIGLGIALLAGNVYVDGQAGTADFPTTTGAFQTSFNVGSGSFTTYAAELTLTPTISFTPTSINFGTQLLSTTSLPQFVTITNNTGSAVALTPAASNTGGNTADFATTAGTCGAPASVPAGSSCTVGVTFTPSAAGARATTLQIFDALDGTGHPLLVALSGNGSATAANITVTPTSLTLPGALLTTTSTGSVSIGNNGNLPLSISSIAAAPGLFTETSMTAACNNGAFPIVIASGGNPCVVTVTFSPVAATTPGPVAGSLTITQTGGNVATVPLSAQAWDFSISAAAISVARGASGSFPVLVTGLGGFTGAVSFTCTPAMLITSCSVATTNAAPAPGASAAGMITATSFIVPPQSLKAPPSALLRQVLFIMLAMALLFMIPSVRRFRTRMGMAGAMLVFILVAGCSGSAGGGSKASTIAITPSSGGVTKAATNVNVTITQ